MNVKPLQQHTRFLLSAFVSTLQELAQGLLKPGCMETGWHCSFCSSQQQQKQESMKNVVSEHFEVRQSGRGGCQTPGVDKLFLQWSADRLALQFIINHPAYKSATGFSCFW